MHVCVGRPAEAPPVVLAWPGPSRQNYRIETAPAFYRVNVYAERPGGCYSCTWFGHRVDVAVWCGKPGCGHVRSQPHLGCAFWQREPGSGRPNEAPGRALADNYCCPVTPGISICCADRMKAVPR